MPIEKHQQSSSNTNSTGALSCNTELHQWRKFNADITEFYVSPFGSGSVRSYQTSWPETILHFTLPKNFSTKKYIIGEDGVAINFYWEGIYYIGKSGEIDVTYDPAKEHLTGTFNFRSARQDTGQTFDFTSGEFDIVGAEK
ncbi:hypothetical protein J2W17_000300 [Pseudomonas lini]|uniref:hypothetical protein n=1 Tax=Pseudomonas lini TaxID=163011 RepID=UPI00277D4C02|nr:hypothetical protein [Pseudomonas lini]MDQ0121363.1 hypothetical protein [Pseudomonas lini]